MSLLRASRRTFLKASGALALGAWSGACATAGSAARATKGPILIVPGTGGGPAMYQRLTDALHARGRDVFAIALAGMGERAAELRPEIDANLHAQEIADFLVQHDLHGVTLAGHSYGGMPMTGAVGRAQGRVTQLVYLDAYVPKNGDSIFTLDPGFAEFIQKRIDEHGESWKIPPFPAKQFLKDEADIAWFDAHATASPLAMYKNPLVVDAAAFYAAHKGYVAFKQFKYFQRVGAALAQAGGKYRVVDAGHMAPYTHPNETADAILAVES
jgi:pimeloyl-ACP methyl ester carboxylesterase